MRGRERERTQPLKLLVYSTNGHNPQDWASLELGAKNSAQGSYVVVGVQDLNHLVLFFFRQVSEDLEQAQSIQEWNLHSNMGCQHCLTPLCHTLLS